MTTMVFIIPAALRDAGNAMAETLGWGSPVFVQPLSPSGDVPPTHWGFPWADPPPDAASVIAGADVIEGEWAVVLSARGLVVALPDDVL